MNWISVGDRLPNANFDWVLVNYDGMMSVMAYTKARGFFGKTENNMEDFTDLITHWMPLPEPPIND